jgi:hypothetical protein
LLFAYYRLDGLIFLQHSMVSPVVSGTAVSNSMGEIPVAVFSAGG